MPANQIEEKIKELEIYVGKISGRLGAIFKKLGDLDNALEMLLLGQGILQKYLSEFHIDLDSIVNNIGLVYKYKGNLEAAL